MRNAELDIKKKEILLGIGFLWYYRYKARAKFLSVTHFKISHRKPTGLALFRHYYCKVCEKCLDSLKKNSLLVALFQNYCCNVCNILGWLKQKYCLGCSYTELKLFRLKTGPFARRNQARKPVKLKPLNGQTYDLQRSPVWRSNPCNIDQSKFVSGRVLVAFDCAFF